MIVCPGCGGRNEPDTDTCTFCQRRLTTSGRGGSHRRETRHNLESMATAKARAATIRKIVLALLTQILLGILIALRTTAVPGTS
jgi:hypothetical protein